MARKALISLIAGALVASCVAERVSAQVRTHAARGTPVVDGIEGGGEWAGAEIGSATVTFPPSMGGGTDQVTLLVQSDDDKVYGAFRVPVGSLPPAPAGFGIDNYLWPNGQDFCAPDPFGDAFEVAGIGDTAYFDDLFWHECGSAYADRDTDFGGTAEGTAAWGDAGDTLFFEWSHPLDSVDDDHDLSVAVGEKVEYYVWAFGCDAGMSDCGLPASFWSRIYLPADGFIFFADFEGNDFGEWSGHVSP